MAFIAFGSNLGDRRAYLAAALCAVSTSRGITLLATSSIEETAPIGSLPQPPYLNRMIAVETTLAPACLLARLQVIEASLGRVRGARWSPRTIDLDIVRFGNVQVRTPSLELPHPGLRDRTFWQREAKELDQILKGAA